MPKPARLHCCWLNTRLKHTLTVKLNELKCRNRILRSPLACKLDPIDIAPISRQLSAVNDLLENRKLGLVYSASLGVDFTAKGDRQVVKYNFYKMTFDPQAWSADPSAWEASVPRPPPTEVQLSGGARLCLWPERSAECEIS